MTRLFLEQKTLSKMISYYCQKKHHSKVLCDDCENLLKYSIGKLNLCMFGGEKPVCSDCRVHCYRKNEREKIREIMKYAGPRMVFISPWLATVHLMQKYRNKKN